MPQITEDWIYNYNGIIQRTKSAVDPELEIIARVPAQVILPSGRTVIGQPIRSIEQLLSSNGHSALDNEVEQDDQGLDLDDPQMILSPKRLPFEEPDSVKPKIFQGLVGLQLIFMLYHVYALAMYKVNVWLVVMHVATIVAYGIAVAPNSRFKTVQLTPAVLMSTVEMTYFLLLISEPIHIILAVLSLSVSYYARSLRQDAMLGWFIPKGN